MGPRPPRWRSSLTEDSRHRGRHASFEADRASADRPVVGLDHVLPVELVLAGQPRVAAGAPGDRADDLAAGSDRLAAQLAEDLVAALVGPDRLAHAAGLAVGKPDDVALETDAQSPLAREQERAGQSQDRRPVITLELERAPGARRRPRALERARLARRQRGPGLDRRSGARGGAEHEQRRAEPRQRHRSRGTSRRKPWSAMAHVNGARPPYVFGAFFDASYASR